MFANVFVPTDGSDFSKATIRRAVEFAELTGGKITVFHAKPTYADVRFGESGIVEPITPEHFEAHQEQETREILEFAVRLCEEHGVKCETLCTASDDPAKAILSAVKTCGADVIFMATRGWNGLGTFFIGSQTRKVLLNSSIPVMVLR